MNTIYQSIKNDYYDFYDFIFIKIFFKNILLLLIGFNLPIFLLENIINLSNNTYINNISFYIYNLFFKIPAFMVFYFIINKKIFTQLEIIYTSRKQPSHIYVNILINFIYFIHNIVKLLITPNIIIFFILNTICYSLYFGQIGYYFLHSKYTYYNYIDYYNYNFLKFIGFSFFYNTLSLTIIPNNFHLIGLFITSILLSPIITNIKYIKYNGSINYYNLFYPFEFCLNYIIFVFGCLFVYIRD